MRDTPFHQNLLAGPIFCKISANSSVKHSRSHNELSNSRRRMHGTGPKEEIDRRAGSSSQTRANGSHQTMPPPTAATTTARETSTATRSPTETRQTQSTNEHGFAATRRRHRSLCLRPPPSELTARSSHTEHTHRQHHRDISGDRRRNNSRRSSTTILTTCSAKSLASRRLTSSRRCRHRRKHHQDRPTTPRCRQQVGHQSPRRSQHGDHHHVCQAHRRSPHRDLRRSPRQA